VNTTGSIFAAYYFNSHSKKAKFKPRDFNPYQQILFVRESREKFDKKTAQMLLELIKTDKLPSWVLVQLTPDRDAILAVTNDG
jgi:hypothetical protein